MKKIINLLVLVAFVSLTGKSQNNFKTTLSLNDFQKMIKGTGDTIWLFGKYEIYKWENNQYKPWDYFFLFDYYPASTNIKTVKYVDYNNDSLFKTDYYYDSLNRDIMEITKNYNNSTDEWINSIKAEFGYNLNGKDSIRTIYTWNLNDSIWENNTLNIKLWNEYGYIKYEADSIWKGQKWDIMGGRKFEYLLNEFHQVVEQSVYVYKDYSNQWNYSYKNVFTLIDEQTGEWNEKTVYIWDNQTNNWENFQRFSDVKIHDWNGFQYFAYWVEYDIMEAWLDNKWEFIKKDSIIFDTLGGKIWYLFGYDNESNKWQKDFKLTDEYNEEGYQIKYYKQIWKNDEWVNNSGYIIDYEFDGPRLMQITKDEWDTITLQWIPFRKYLYDNYTSILNIENKKIKKNEPDFQIIPNPSKTSILIKLNGETDGIKSVKVYDISGRQVFSKRFNSGQAGERLKISQLKNGTYILNVETREGRNLKGKFIKN